MCEVFFSRIYVADIRRDSIFAYFRKRGATIAYLTLLLFIFKILYFLCRLKINNILMTKPGSLNSILANWTILLSQYNMTFVLQKAVKGQALADFLTAHPVPKTFKLHTGIPNEVIEANMTSEDDVWQIFFDGAPR